MGDVFKALTSTYIYQTFSFIIMPLWSDPVGRIFILTILSYFVAYSIYSGYLDSFTGGFGGLSFSRIGLQVTDLITLFPTAVFTIIDITIKLLRSSFFLVVKGVIYLATSLFLGVYVGLLLRQSQLQIPSIFSQLSLTIYLIGFLFSSFLIGSQIRNKRKWLLFIWIVQIIGAAISIAARPVSSQIQSFDNPSLEAFSINVLYPLSFELLAFTILFASFLLPNILGRQMAEAGMKHDILSKVAVLTVKQPLLSLQSFEKNTSIPTSTLMPVQQSWFTKAVIPIAMEPDTYVYSFARDTPLYLVASFSDLTAFYIAKKNGQFADGNLLIVARELIHAVELHSPKI